MRVDSVMSVSKDTVTSNYLALLRRKSGYCAAWLIPAVTLVNQGPGRGYGVTLVIKHAGYPDFRMELVGDLGNDSRPIHAVEHAWRRGVWVPNGLEAYYQLATYFPLIPGSIERALASNWYVANEQIKHELRSWYDECDTTKLRLQPAYWRNRAAMITQERKFLRSNSLFSTSLVRATLLGMSHEERLNY